MIRSRLRREISEQLPAVVNQSIGRWQRKKCVTYPQCSPTHLNRIVSPRDIKCYAADGVRKNKPLAIEVQNDGATTAVLATTAFIPILILIGAPASG